MSNTIFRVGTANMYDNSIRNVWCVPATTPCRPPRPNAR